MESLRRNERFITQGNELELITQANIHNLLCRIGDGKNTAKTWRYGRCVRAQRRRMRQYIDGEWYHIMASSARITYNDQVLHCHHVLKLTSAVGRGASTRDGLPST